MPQYIVLGHLAFYSFYPFQDLDIDTGVMSGRVLWEHGKGSGLSDMKSGLYAIDDAHYGLGARYAAFAAWGVVW